MTKTKVQEKCDKNRRKNLYNCMLIQKKKRKNIPHRNEVQQTSG